MRLAAAIAALSLAASAGAVVVADHDELAAPLDGYVGEFNGSSAVCIAPNWIITARHVGGGTEDQLVLRGEEYRAVEFRPHPVADLQLVRVDRTLPGYHMIASTAAPGDLAILGGWGVTAGEAISGGYAWSDERAETWGANTIDSVGSLLTIRFDYPDSDAAVPHEAVFAVNDSGAGLFVYGPTGELELAGIAISVTGFGQSLYGCRANCLNLDRYRDWISPIANPGAPIASSVEAPRE